MNSFERKHEEIRDCLKESEALKDEMEKLAIKKSELDAKARELSQWLWLNEPREESYAITHFPEEEGERGESFGLSRIESETEWEGLDSRQTDALLKALGNNLFSLAKCVGLEWESPFDLEEKEFKVRFLGNGRAIIADSAKGE